VKEKLENYLHVEACAGHIPIEQAQKEIAEDHGVQSDAQVEVEVDLVCGRFRNFCS